MNARIRTLPEIIIKVKGEIKVMSEQLKFGDVNQVRKQRKKRELRSLEAYLEMLEGGDPGPYLESLAELGLLDD